jgi:hypothetical protein
MRRFVDSLILVLIAYSVCWPIARGLMANEDRDGAAATFAVSRAVEVRIDGCATIPQATLHVARSETDARAGRFALTRVQRAGREGVRIDLREALDLAWLVVELPGRRLPPRPLHLADGAAPLRLDLAPDLPLVVGSTAPVHGALRAVVSNCTRTTSIEVPCDAAGRFVFVAPALESDAVLRIETGHGGRLHECAVPRGPGIRDLGRVDR